MPSDQTTLGPTPADAADKHFRTDQLKSNLGRRTARGGALTITTQGIKFVFSTGTTVVLARLLTPQDYGLIGMVAVVTGFISLFRDLGLSQATVQKEKINAAQVSTLFWINLTLSVVVMLITVALAPAVAWFYGEPRLNRIMMVYAIGFIFGGLTVQHDALLRRQMRFVALTATDLASLLCGITTAILLAWHGAQYWALVASQLVTGFVGAAGVWILSGWRPSLPKKGSGIRSMLAFGGNLTGFTIVNYLARNIDNLLIGRFWGSQQLGLYARAYQLLLLPIDQINQPVASVAVPALSRLTDSPERYRQAYSRILEKVTMLTMPGVAFMIGTSDWIVRIALGPNWSGAAKIFALLGISGLIQPTCNTAGWLFISQGRTRQMFQWGMIGSGIIIAAILIGLPWGAVGVSTSYSLALTFIAAPLLFWFIGREGHVRTRDIYLSILPASLAATSVLVSLFAFRRMVVIGRPLNALGISFALSSVVTLLALFAFPRGRNALLDFKRTVTLLFNKPDNSTQVVRS
jgi:PST family polysaccharide transporter